MSHFDVVIIGAGAAGLMCAAVAGDRGRRVLVLDHQGQVGRKVLLSGGGRCNFTNTDAGAGHYLSRNPHFAKSALARFTPADFIAMVERHGIPYHEKKDGQLFCDDSAHDILAMLLAECKNGGVAIQSGVSVKQVTREGEAFRVETGDETFACDSLVVASGGLSLPKVGATSFGYKLAEQFGIPMVPPRAGLAPFTWGEKDRNTWERLAGISSSVRVTCGKVSFAEALLFTHRGLSGPAILQISSYWTPGTPVFVDWFPGEELETWLAGARKKRPKAVLRSLLAERLPRRLAAVLCTELEADEQLCRLSDARLREIAESLHGWEFLPGGSEGYRTAEVTVGGVDTDALSSRTMEAKAVPGLYFVGEVVDVTGWLGGFNFQWAWASGHAAGEAV